MRELVKRGRMEGKNDHRRRRMRGKEGIGWEGQDHTAGKERDDPLVSQG